MNDNRKRIISVAESYIGIDVKPGSAARKDIVDSFNIVKPQGYTAHTTDDWCAEFVTACVIIAFGKKTAVSYFPLSASCPVMIKAAKAKSIWKEKDSYKPQPGDFVLFDWDDPGKGGDNRGTPNHVGIVQKVEDGDIYTIEGNFHDKVGIREFPINWRYIRGFVCPLYDRFETPVKVSRDDVLKAVISGKYGTGEKQKKRIKDAGFDPDQIRTEAAKIKKLTTEVLKGKYGTGDERKSALGKYYKLVQWNVNRVLKEKQT